MEGRENGLYLSAVRFVLRRQHQTLAQSLRRLIDGEPRWIGRELEQHPSGLAKVHRVEVLPIDDRGRIESRMNDLLAELELSSIVGHPPGDVVDRACSSNASREATDASDVHPHSRAAVTSGITSRASILADGTKPKGMHQDLLSGVASLDPEGHPVKAVDGVLSRNTRAFAPG
jgi:hypothetical protein